MAHLPRPGAYSKPKTRKASHGCCFFRWKWLILHNSIYVYKLINLKIMTTQFREYPHLAPRANVRAYGPFSTLCAGPLTIFMQTSARATWCSSPRPATVNTQSLRAWSLVEPPYRRRRRRRNARLNVAVTACVVPMNSMTVPSGHGVTSVADCTRPTNCT